MVTSLFVSLLKVQQLKKEKKLKKKKKTTFTSILYTSLYYFLKSFCSDLPWFIKITLTTPYYTQISLVFQNKLQSPPLQYNIVKSNNRN